MGAGGVLITGARAGEWRMGLRIRVRPALMQRRNSSVYGRKELKLDEDIQRWAEVTVLCCA